MSASPVTNRQREEMRRLRALHVSICDIAAVTGRTERCVWDHVKDMGIAVRHGLKTRTPAQNARLLAAAADGLTREELGARFGLSPKSVGPTLSRLRKAQRTAGEARA